MGGRTTGVRYIVEMTSWVYPYPSGAGSPRNIALVRFIPILNPNKTP